MLVGDTSRSRLKSGAASSILWSRRDSHPSNVESFRALGLAGVDDVDGVDGVDGVTRVPYCAA